MTTPEWMERTALLMGEEKMERIRRAHVLVVGAGGVGAYAAEMLVRAGVGRLTLWDADRVQPSNINRQLCALHSTVNENKVDILARRFKDINPELELETQAAFLEEGEHVLAKARPADCFDEARVVVALPREPRIREVAAPVAGGKDRSPTLGRALKHHHGRPVLGG